MAFPGVILFTVVPPAPPDALEREVGGMHLEQARILIDLVGDLRII
jgi:hypothetical protein